MNQTAVIPCIISLNKLLALTIDNYFINYEALKRTPFFYDYEKLQIKIHMLREQLISGFSWYCGSTIENETKRIEEDLLDPENTNPFRQQYNLLNLALEQNQTICKGLVANQEYKQLFRDIKDTCEKQLNLTTQVLTEIKKKHTKSHFVPKYIKSRKIKETYASH